LEYFYKPFKKNASLRELIIFLNSKVNKAPITYVTPINLRTCLEKYSENFELVLLINPLHLCILQKLFDSHNKGCFFPAVLVINILFKSIFTTCTLHCITARWISNPKTWRSFRLRVRSTGYFFAWEIKYSTAFVLFCTSATLVGSCSLIHFT
jgi:hypothetical protein